MKQIKLTIIYIFLFHILKKYERNVSDTLFSWYLENGFQNTNVNYKHLSNLFDLIAPNRLKMYLDRLMRKSRCRDKYNSAQAAAKEYYDYLQMASILEFDLTKEVLLFPLNLAKAHDELIPLAAKAKAELYRKRIAEAYLPLLEQFSFCDETLTIIPPKSVDDLIAEGNVLGHCVGSYAERVAEKACNIFFVRKRNAQDQPYYTVEVFQNKVVQVQGLGRCKPTPEVSEFLALWTMAKLSA